MCKAKANQMKGLQSILHPAKGDNQGKEPIDIPMIEENLVTVNYRIPASLQKKLKLEAIERGITMKELISEIIKNHLKDEG